MAFGDTPSLRERGKVDNTNYVEMERRGELRTYQNAITPVNEFMADIAADLARISHQ